MKKDPHVIIEKRLMFSIKRTAPKDRVSTKEGKRVRGHVSAEYEKWRHKYTQKWGVIGADGHPTATMPRSGSSGWTIDVAMKVPFIVTRWRARYESLLRFIDPKSMAVQVANVVYITKGGSEDGP